MRNTRGAWSLAGLVAGFAGLATSYFVAMGLTIRESPVIAVADLVVRSTPGAVAESIISAFGRQDKPFLVAMILLLLALMFLTIGRLARNRWWWAVAAYVALTALGMFAVLTERGSTATDVLPLAVGLATWVVALSLLTEPLRRGELAGEVAADSASSLEDPTSARARRAGEAKHRAALAVQGQTRRGFLGRAALIGAGAVVIGVAARVVGRGRRQVEQARKLLRLTGVSTPVVPDGARLDVAGISPWVTPAADFYLIDTAISKPTIEPANWSLRIHGMVDKEIVLTYDELLAREMTEAWVTLNCVSNEIGGGLIGNAWWSGVRIAPLLAEAGVQAGADAVLQTSDDGWTCGTPIEAVTDDRNAMLAVAMNGKPLPIEHGFPVRSLVPGLYGYVSATKWVVDFKVTRFADFTAFWTANGWGEKGPVKMASRIDVPRYGKDVTRDDSGSVVVAGMAWSQQTGISAVEVAVDGGAWQPAEIAKTPSADTWVQWKAVVTVAEGKRSVRVRATDADGMVQTSVVRDVLPDGATGLDAIQFQAV